MATAWACNHKLVDGGGGQNPSGYQELRAEPLQQAIELTPLDVLALVPKHLHRRREVRILIKERSCDGAR